VLEAKLGVEALYPGLRDAKLAESGRAGFAERLVKRDFFVAALTKGVLRGGFLGVGGKDVGLLCCHGSYPFSLR